MPLAGPSSRRSSGLTAKPWSSRKLVCGVGPGMATSHDALGGYGCSVQSVGPAERARHVDGDFPGRHELSQVALQRIDGLTREGEEVLSQRLLNLCLRAAHKTGDIDRRVTQVRDHSLDEPINIRLVKSGDLNQGLPTQ